MLVGGNNGGEMDDGLLLLLLLLLVVEAATGCETCAVVDDSLVLVPLRIFALPIFNCCCSVVDPIIL